MGYLADILVPIEEWAKLYGIDEEVILRAAKELGMDAVVKDKKASAREMDRISYHLFGW